MYLIAILVKDDKTKQQLQYFLTEVMYLEDAFKCMVV